MNFFILENGFDIAKFEKEYNAIKNPTVFSLDYETHKILQKKGIPHKIGEEILEKNDFDEIDEFSINFTKKLFLNYKKYFTFEKIFLPELIELEFYQYLLIQYLKPLVIFKIIINHIEKNDTVFNFTIYDNFINSIIKTKNSVYCKSYSNESTSSLYHDKIKFSVNIFKRPFHVSISRNTFTKIKHIQNFFLNNIYNFKPNYSSTKKNILLINFDPLQYEELLFELKNPKTNFMLLNTRKPAITNLKSLNIVKNANLKIADLQKFSSNNLNNSQITMLEKNLRHIFNDRDHFNTIFSIHNHSFWNCIESSFQTIFYTRFTESIKRLISLTNFFKSVSIDKILVWVDVGQEEKECIMIGRQFQIPSIMLQHGRFQTSKIWDKFAQFVGQFPAPLLSDKQIVWGDMVKRYAISHSHSPENIIVGGSPRHDKFFTQKTLHTKNNTVVLATTGTMFLSADSCTTQSQVKYDKFIIEVCRIIKTLKNFQLIVKPHPSQILTEYVRNLIQEIDPDIMITEDHNNEKLFSSANLVITFNNSTTALEALILGTPVISLQTEDWANEDDVARSNAITCISNIPDCENKIKQILFEKDFHKTLSKNRIVFLEDYLKNPGNASKSIAKILKDDTL
tara:strand:- start:3802 stop:5673 length:1872 start_codon:yes stop_codon:yes gene_type:complete